MRGLYAIPPAQLEGEKLLDAAREALEGGCRLLQYRDKSDDAARRLRDARALGRLCRRHGALFIVNDDLELAAAAAADGVHLGRDDASLAEARARLGDGAIVGISCYADWERALAAREQGASYLAFGAFYPSPTKPHAARANLQLLHRARRELKLPAVAIGGITPENAQPLIAAGADVGAADETLDDRHHVRAAARRISALF